jgi:transcriptional regulator with XRE-family HTH domain
MALQEDRVESIDGRSALGELLESFRTARGWSQGRLAQQARFDPSFVSRLEAGTRAPERETVNRLADALVLPIADRDRLMAAAGFRSITLDDPLISELALLLADPSLPESVERDLRAVIRMAISYARNSRDQR